MGFLYMLTAVAYLIGYLPIFAVTSWRGYLIIFAVEVVALVGLLAFMARATGLEAAAVLVLGGLTIGGMVLGSIIKAGLLATRCGAVTSAVGFGVFLVGAATPPLMFILRDPSS